MIIDAILDRRDGKRYSPSEFEEYVVGRGYVILDDAYKQRESKTKEYAVKRALVLYVAQGYNLDIVNYILSVQWT